jgi:sRNA-binding carbon storage regulator CsrA
MGALVIARSVGGGERGRVELTVTVGELKALIPEGAGDAVSIDLGTIDVIENRGYCSRLAFNLSRKIRIFRSEIPKEERRGGAQTGETAS